ncbi:MAG: dockerin type I repeat-containing protein [Candidatus Krumholzibacteriia bacterium]
MDRDRDDRSDDTFEPSPEGATGDVLRRRPERPAESRPGDLPDHLPEALRTELASLYRTGVAIPRERDDAVLAAARARLGVRREHPRRERGRLMRPVWQRPLPAAWAAAASVVLLVAVGFGLLGDGGPTVPPAGSGDLNGDGVVDVLDAFLLARRLDASRPAPLGSDRDGDGRVTRADLAALTAQIVSVGEVR